MDKNKDFSDTRETIERASEASGAKEMLEELAKKMQGSRKHSGHSGMFIRAEELQYILKTMVDIFTSLAHDDDLETFKKENPGLDWSMGFEEAIYKFADRRSSRELMIAALIKDIKQIEARNGD